MYNLKPEVRYAIHLGFSGQAGGIALGRNTVRVGLGPEGIIPMFGLGLGRVLWLLKHGTIKKEKNT